MLEYFHQGGAFMYPILFILILGLAISIERFISLFRAGVDTRSFINNVTKAFDKEGAEGAMKVCQDTEGPVANVFHAGLLRLGRGIDHVEKAISNAGSIEMAFLERNMSWLSTFISIAPMLGFTGTVVGMIKAFNDIAQANDISPAIVADGISIALLTTCFGLIVAIILQLVYNFFISKIDSLVIDMEESSVELIDHLAEKS